MVIREPRVVAPELLRLCFGKQEAHHSSTDKKSITPESVTYQRMPDLRQLPAFRHPMVGDRSNSTPTTLPRPFPPTRSWKPNYSPPHQSLSPPNDLRSIPPPPRMRCQNERTTSPNRRYDLPPRQIWCTCGSERVDDVWGRRIHQQ